MTGLRKRQKYPNSIMEKRLCIYEQNSCRKRGIIKSDIKKRLDDVLAVCKEKEQLKVSQKFPMNSIIKY